LADPTLADQTLRGFLTGSIDAVLRVPGPEGEPRYLVVDYKTNWLGPLDRPPLTVGQYTPPRMAEAMIRAHYPLQALLYAVAVHRLLRWRQPGYDPDRHLGGVLYLFVRGMAGPSTPTVDEVPCGVFSWRPPGALVAALSDRLDGDPT
jgi:exodeoxyribonuclease V beta subunit